MKLINKLSPTMKETFLYAVSGVLTTLVNFTTSYFLYNVCGINENITNAVAWITAIIFAFLAAHFFVFGTSAKEKGNNISPLKRFIMFVFGRLFTLFIELFATYVFVTRLKNDFWIIKFIISAIIIVLNYIISKFIVFKKNNNK